MAQEYFIRVAAVGSENDMTSLIRTMLANGEALDEDDGSPEPGLQGLNEKLLRHAAWELGEGASFDYACVAPHPFGSAKDGRYELTRLPGGLWAASFAYTSEDRFQPEDWLKLHRDADRIPMGAIYAGDTFDMDKGGAAFIGGRMMEDWSRMAETWFWLRKKYELGRIPEDIPDKLEAIAAALRQEAWDQSVGELLAACSDNLSRAEQGRDISEAMLRGAATSRDFDRLLELQLLTVDSVLFDTQHAALYQACLRQDMDCWHSLHPEDAGETEALP